MSELTPEADLALKLRQADALGAAVSEWLDIIAAAIRAAEQRGRLAGWEEAREACLKECDTPLIGSKLGVWWARGQREIKDAIAALTPKGVTS